MSLIMKLFMNYKSCKNYKLTECMILNLIKIF